MFRLQFPQGCHSTNYVVSSISTPPIAHPSECSFCNNTSLCCHLTCCQQVRFYCNSVKHLSHKWFQIQNKSNFLKFQLKSVPNEDEKSQWWSIAYIRVVKEMSTNHIMTSSWKSFIGWGEKRFWCEPLQNWCVRLDPIAWDNLLRRDAIQSDHHRQEYW